MRNFVRKRTLLILYFMGEMFGSLGLLYLAYMMLGWIGVLIAAIGTIHICRKVDKMLKER